MFETDNWYAVAGGDNLRPNQVIPAILNGTELAVWRDSSGAVRAHSNFCVHRGMRLSHGSVRDDHLVCRYHGWRYQADGKCDHIPALPASKPAAAHCVKSYPVGESGGLVWVSLGEPGNSAASILEQRDDQNTAVYCRSIWIACSPEAVMNRLATAEYHCKKVAHGILEIASNLDDNSLLLAVQPVSEKKTGIHISIERGIGGVDQRLHYANWAKTLRWTLENDSNFSSMQMTS